MNFLKKFLIEHPIISMLAGFAILDRAEEACMIHHARKTGQPYYGRRYRINVPVEGVKNATEVKEE